MTASIPTAIQRVLGPADIQQVLKYPKTSVKKICQTLDIPYRVTRTMDEPIVVLVNDIIPANKTRKVGEELITHVKTYIDIQGKPIVLYIVCLPLLEKKQADIPPDILQHAQILEVLAYGFFDYAARESVCFKGYFVYPAHHNASPLGRGAG